MKRLNPLDASFVGDAVFRNARPDGTLPPEYDEEIARRFGLGRHARTRNPDPLAYARAVKQLDGGSL